MGPPGTRGNKLKGRQKATSTALAKVAKVAKNDSKKPLRRKNAGESLP